MAPSRGLQGVLWPLVCRGCQKRTFTMVPSLSSGHNRWSKIKHDKAKADSSKSRGRSRFSQEIASASRAHGPDPALNPHLHELITKAKREGFAKSSIEAAIARGQGRSLSGGVLENVTVEGMLPNGVAVIVECETDGKLRTLAEVRNVLKEWGGSATPTEYLFTKKGRVVLEEKQGIGMENVLETALEAGALDVEEDEKGRVVVWTKPSDTRTVGDNISKALGLQIATSVILWDPNEDTKVGIPNEAAAGDVAGFLDELQEKEQTVQSVALNVSQGILQVDEWGELKARFAS